MDSEVESLLEKKRSKGRRHGREGDVSMCVCVEGVCVWRGDGGEEEGEEEGEGIRRGWFLYFSATFFFFWTISK